MADGASLGYSDDFFTEEEADRINDKIDSIYNNNTVVACVCCDEVKRLFKEQKGKTDPTPVVTLCFSCPRTYSSLLDFVIAESGKPQEYFKAKWERTLSESRRLTVLKTLADLSKPKPV
jgi:hypothetical protein